MTSKNTSLNKEKKQQCVNVIAVNSTMYLLGSKQHQIRPELLKNVLNRKRVTYTS